MSEQYMESAFPLANHTHADIIRRTVDGSLYGENVEPSVEHWSDEAVIYIRSSWTFIRERLADEGIVLSPSEETDLIDFSSEYASLVDGEEDMAEIAAFNANREAMK